MKRLLAIPVAAMLLTGCAGPERPLDLGFKEVPSNVVLGAQSTPTPTATALPPGPVPLPPPPPPSVVSLPPPPFEVPTSERPQPSPSPLPPPAACPPGDPLEPPELEARSTISRPPVPAAYLFDNVGSYAVSGADARRGSFPEHTVRAFGNVVRASAGSFSYDVTERIGETTTTTTYRVVTDASLPSQTNGFFLARMTYARSDGVTASFTPVPELQVAALPLIRGATSDQRGVDPQTQTAMSFTSTIAGKARVFACGEPLDTWTVHLTKGTLVSPDQSLQFDAKYQLATQFGGIIVRDSVAFAGNDGGSTLQRSNRATINTVPRLP